MRRARTSRRCGSSISSRAVIFDTELASRMLGHDRVGLGAVVEDTLGITLAKAHSASDWSTRPLPQSWLDYAAKDVEHLVDVRDALVAELEEQGKTEFAREEFAAVLERAPQAGAGGPVAPAERAAHRARSPRARRGALALAGTRGVRAGAGHRPRSPGARSLADRGGPRRSQVEAGARRAQGLHRAAPAGSQLDRWWAAIEAGRAETELPPDRVPERHAAASRGRGWIATPRPTRD